MRKKLIVKSCIVLCFAAAAAASAQSVDAPMPSAKEAALAALDSALHLANMIDAAQGQNPGVKVSLSDALRMARESAPKSQPSAGSWEASGSQVGFSLDSALLCRSLAQLCSERQGSEPGICSCAPESEGRFKFVFLLEAQP